MGFILKRQTEKQFLSLGDKTKQHITVVLRN